MSVVSLHDAALIRQRVVERKSKRTNLLTKIIDAILDYRDLGVSAHANEILLSLLNLDIGALTEKVTIVSTAVRS